MRLLSFRLRLKLSVPNMGFGFHNSLFSRCWPVTGLFLLIVSPGSLLRAHHESLNRV